LHVIKWLLDAGAKPNETFKLNNVPTTLELDLKQNVSSNRYEQIMDLFKQYKSSNEEYQKWKILIDDKWVNIIDADEVEEEYQEWLSNTSKISHYRYLNLAIKIPCRIKYDTMEAEGTVGDDKYKISRNFL
jgi:hypothetical protein